MEHPDPAKRLGGALAVNRLYRILREEDTLVEQFVVELLLKVSLHTVISRGGELPLTNGSNIQRCFFL
jgi:hypothetical protein